MFNQCIDITRLFRAGFRASDIINNLPVYTWVKWNNIALETQKAAYWPWQDIIRTRNFLTKTVSPMCCYRGLYKNKFWIQVSLAYLTLYIWSSYNLTLTVIESVVFWSWREYMNDFCVYCNTVCPREKETHIKVQNFWTRLTDFKNCLSNLIF